MACVEISWNRNFINTLEDGIKYEIRNTEAVTVRNIEAAMKRLASLRIVPVKREILRFCQWMLLL